MNKIGTKNNTYEIVFFKFQEHISIEEQTELMSTLTNLASSYEGFKYREYYYSRENKFWVDLVVWETLEQAKKASEEIMKNPLAGTIFGKIDQKSMVFSHYEKIN